jgi:[ribosomal protein S5]-alanine N-acetyltransferase
MIFSQQRKHEMNLSQVRYTARLRLEPIGLGHAVDLWRLFSDPAVAAWYGTWTLEMAQREVERIAAAWETDGIHKWMAYDRHTGELVGRGGLSRVRLEGQECLEIGWALLQPRWGRGYATEIGRAGLAVAFGELGADEVVAYTEVRNGRSRAVMERLGMCYLRDILLEEDDVPCAFYAIRRLTDRP